jgi:hypothetical protein
MKCPECGQEIVGADKFCNNCGASLPNQESAAPPADPEPIADEDNGQLETAGDELESGAGEPEDLAEEPEAVLDQAEAVLEGTELPPAESETPFAASETDTPPGPPPVVKAKGKTNTGLIIGIVVLVFLLLCCCCAIGLIVSNFEAISLWLETAIELTPMP